MEMKRPLEGVKVVELATFIAAPCCTRFLADLGAEVIKVEAPMGDPLRFTAVNEGRPYGDQEDTSFTLENTGKKLITLNIKTANGRKVMEELLAQADVFVTNNRPNSLKKNGLDYETLHARYPKLVFAMVSGYGEKGPDKDLPGFDFTSYFARAGILGTMFDVNSTWLPACWPPFTGPGRPAWAIRWWYPCSTPACGISPCICSRPSTAWKRPSTPSAATRWPTSCS